MSIRISVSPHGRLTCEEAADDAPSSLSQAAVTEIEAAFERSSAEGLLSLASLNAREIVPADLLFWRAWAQQFLQAICQLDEERLALFAKSAQAKAGPVLEGPPDVLALTTLIAAAPPMRGLEYLTPDVLQALWL